MLKKENIPKSSHNSGDYRMGKKSLGLKLSFIEMYLFMHSSNIYYVFTTYMTLFQGERYGNNGIDKILHFPGKEFWLNIQ